MIKSKFVNVNSGSAWTRVKAYPWADVYHQGQRACRVYISRFRMDMFRIGNAAVGNDFNQITLFLSWSPLFQSAIPFKNFLFVLQDSKQLLLSIMSMSLPALGWMWPLHFLPYSFQRWAMKCCSIWASSGPWGSLKGMQFVIWNKICKSGMVF